MTQAYRARYWHALEDGRLQCDLCPRGCRLGEGQRGLCFVRERQDDAVILSTYGRSSGFCVDPIEKKPLYHFLPGSAVLSFGTAGCNLTCKFCQNWDISKSRSDDTLADRAAPETIARAAQRLGCASVAFTYNDPVIFHEYAVDVAAACHQRGVRTVAVTAGYVCPEPRAEFYRHIDAANVDLKAFSERFYRSLCSAELGAVLDTLRYLKHETPVRLEITTLLIPGENDGPAELEAECRWIVEELGADVPLHFSAFHPDYRLTDRARTPHATLVRAYEIGRAAGLRHIYLGNVDDPERSCTRCNECGARLIERQNYALTGWALTAEGACRQCGEPLSGLFAAEPGRWGNRRLPIRLADFEGPAGGSPVPYPSRRK